VRGITVYSRALAHASTCRARPPCFCPLGDLRHNLDQVSIRVPQQCVAVVIAGVVWRLNDAYTSGFQLRERGVHFIRPYDQDHGGAAGRRIDSVHPLCCLQCS
jgi:hypothetical protein